MTRRRSEKAGPPKADLQEMNDNGELEDDREPQRPHRRSSIQVICSAPIVQLDMRFGPLSRRIALTQIGFGHTHADKGNEPSDQGQEESY